jgi:hypothetical protein
VRTPPLDVLTVLAVALTVGLLGSVIHEGLGHAGTALVLGAKAVSIGSAVMNYAPRSVGPSGQRLIALAGPLASLGQGWIGLAALRRTAVGTGWYFWWLLGHTGLFSAAGYLLVLSFAGFGDVHEVLQGLPLEEVWRGLATLLGAALAYWALVHAARTLAAHLPVDRSARRASLERLTVLPYLLVGTVSVVITALGTRDVFLTLASAGAASFGSGVLLLWVMFVVPRLRRAPAALQQIEVPRHWGWAAAGGLALLIWAAVLGPSR